MRALRARRASQTIQKRIQIPLFADFCNISLFGDVMSIILSFQLNHTVTVFFLSLSLFNQNIKKTVKKFKQITNTKNDKFSAVSLYVV